MPAFLTTSGLQKFAVATPEEPVTVKYMAVGSGTGTVSENIQSLFNEVYRTEIPNPLRDEDNPRNLEFTGYLPTTVGGWTITELGLYDSSGVLVAYHLLDESIVKSSPDSALKTDMYPTFILALSNAEDVNLFVSDSVEFDHEALTGRSKSNSHPISAITGLQTALDQKTTDLNNAKLELNSDIGEVATDANSKDAQNVKLSGNQTIAGVKTFTSPIVTIGSSVTGIPIANVTNLQTQLDQKTTDLNTKDTQNVKLTGNQTVAGIKTFSNPIVTTGANITAIPSANVTGLPEFRNEFNSTKAVKKITANYTVLGTDSGVIEIDASSGNIVVTMAKSTSHVTKNIAFIRLDSSINSVTINPANGDIFIGEGATFSTMNVSANETILMKTANNSWLGMRSLSSVIQRSPISGFYNLTYKGVDIARVMTTNEALGWGQAYQDVTASRVVGVTYTNSTTRPITAVITMRMSDDNLNANFIINSVTVGTMYGSQTSGTLDVSVVNTIVIPAGMTYSVSAGQLLKWTELR